MKKTSARIREDLARLQELLKQAETREAERIGRIALKAGLGEVEIDESALQSAFEDLANRFRQQPGFQGARTSERTSARAGGMAHSSVRPQTEANTALPPSGETGEV
jgi:ribosomal protein L5